MLTWLTASLRAVLLPNLTGLSSARTVSPHHTRRMECCGSWGRCNRWMTTVGSGVQRRISESLLRMLVLHTGRWNVPFRAPRSLLRAGCRGSAARPAVVAHLGDGDIIDDSFVVRVMHVDPIHVYY